MQEAPWVGGFVWDEKFEVPLNGIQFKWAEQIVKLRNEVIAGPIIDNAFEFMQEASPVDAVVRKSMDARLHKHIISLISK